jgi:hypothetical protein
MPDATGTFWKIMFRTIKKQLSQFEAETLSSQFPKPSQSQTNSFTKTKTTSTMMIKFTVVLTTLFLAMTGINADKLRSLRNGPPGPGGFRGPKGGFGGRCGGIDESDLVDLECPDNSASEPDCALRNGELGTWLCRTIFESLTGESDSWSTCGNATRALPLDKCGCCDGACPVECTCGCPLQDVADAGVLVTMARPSGEGNERCLKPEKAISLIAKPGGRFQCVTECPVVVVP